MKPWELLCRPASAGVFLHSAEMLQGPEFMIYRERFANRASVIGISPPGMIGLAIPIGPGRETRYWGSANGWDSVPLTTPGPLDVALCDKHEHLVGFASELMVRRSLSDREYAALKDMARQRHVRIGSNQIAVLASWLSTTIAAFRDNPSLADSSECMRVVLDELMQKFRNVAQSILPCEHPVAAPNRRRTGLCQVLEYLRDQQGANPTMSSLCAVSGLSERSIEVAFQESLGLSPRKFMNLRRLHQVRRDLVSSNRQTHTVGKIAMRHGFYELGRFAGNYRRYFGELPSQTLQRTTEEALV